jgi:hypothetical protein
MAVLCPAPPSASRGCPYAGPLVLEACCTPARVCTRLSLHDSAQQEPSAAPPRVRTRLNQLLKALTAFESVPPSCSMGLSGDGPRGAGAQGVPPPSSAAWACRGMGPVAREPRAFQGGAGASAGTSRGAHRGRGGRWKSRGAGEALASCWEAPAGGRQGGRGAAGGWDGVKSGFIFPIRRCWRSLRQMGKQRMAPRGDPQGLFSLRRHR